MAVGLEEYREWSALQIEDAQKTTEATEDAVHEISIGSAAPSLRDAAEAPREALRGPAARWTS